MLQHDIAASAAVQYLTIWPPVNAVLATDLLQKSWANTKPVGSLVYGDVKTGRQQTNISVVLFQNL